MTIHGISEYINGIAELHWWAFKGQLFVNHQHWEWKKNSKNIASIINDESQEAQTDCIHSVISMQVGFLNQETE